MTIHQLPAPTPPDNLLARAVGYDGDASLVGLYWVPGIDEAMITDGRVTFDGHFLGYLDYARHPLVAPILWQWNLGSSEDEATHWLLLDRAAQTLSVAPRAEAERLLREQWPPAAEQPVKAWTDADLHAFVAQQIASIDPAAGQAKWVAMEQARAEMTAWLDSQPITAEMQPYHDTYAARQQEMLARWQDNFAGGTQ